MTWSWRELVKAKPSSVDTIGEAAMQPRQAGDGIYRTPAGYVARIEGINSLQFELTDYPGLKYMDQGDFLPWLQNLEYESLPQ